MNHKFLHFKGYVEIRLLRMSLISILKISLPDIKDLFTRQNLLLRLSRFICYFSSFLTCDTTRSAIFSNASATCLLS